MKIFLIINTKERRALNCLIVVGRLNYTRCVIYGVLLPVWAMSNIILLARSNTRNEKYNNNQL